MARVHNWQLGREMSYWYPESRPKRQFAAVFDINKCIACQTCTLACKTTWTSGRGQEYMLWNNVETKPWGSYPLAYDVKLLEMLNGQEWNGRQYAGQTIFESAPAGERVLGWRPGHEDYAYPNVGEDDCTGQVDHGAAISMPHMNGIDFLEPDARALFPKDGVKITSADKLKMLGNYDTVEKIKAEFGDKLPPEMENQRQAMLAGVKG